MSETPSLLTSLAPTAFHPDSIALFLDFDGTLAPIAEHPDAVAVPPKTMKALAALAEQVPLAILSGRPIHDLDRFLSPLMLPAAGVHGLERRSADGTIHRVPIADDALEAVREALSPFVMKNPGLLLEHKPGSIALHFRKRPELAEACAECVREATAAHGDALTVVPGKMVLDIKAGAATKGDALRAFMNEAPFVGRRAFFAGDDVTDEAAFSALQASDAITVKIGPGETAARYRCAGPETFAEWLMSLALTMQSLERENELTHGKSKGR